MMSWKTGKDLFYLGLVVVGELVRDMLFSFDIFTGGTW